MAFTTIDDPSAYFHVQLYTGNDGTDRLITNDANAGDFRPDFLWLKNRDATGRPVVFDSSRLASGEATMRLSTDLAYVHEDKVDRFGGFETDGFTVDGSDDDTNENADKYVAWQWKANGGSISATFSEVGTNPAGNRQVNTTAGFSLMTWTGTGVIDSGTSGTIAHGLGAVPHFWMIKCLSNAHDWAVYHHKNTAAPETDFLVLNETNATADSDGKWNDTAPTSTNITLKDGGGVNRNDETHVGYVWTEIQGYSKFGSYTGNGVANGPFVYTGFSPAFIIIKKTSGSGQWLMFDNKRNENNPTTSWLAAEVNTAETADSNKDIDMLSNGFKARETGGDMNDDGGTYVYIAFAQQPVVTSTGVPATAR